jgi:small conductance mechanosensitive channel
MESLIVTVKSAVEGMPLPDVVKPYIIMAVPLLMKVIYGLLILWVGKKVADWSEGFSKSLLEKAKVDVSLSGFLSSLVKYTVLAIAIMATLDQIGVKTTGLLAIFASAGLAIGLALQGSLANFAAGTMILGFRPFQIGDVVTAAGTSGCVESIGIFTTTLLTLDNEIIIVPNASVTGGNIQNYTAKDFRRVHTDIGVAYGEDLDKCEEVLLKAAAKTAKRLEDKEPDAFITGFGASSIDFNVRVFCSQEDYWAVLHDLRKQVYAGLNEAGIEIPFNQMVIHQAPAEDSSK